MPRQPLDSFASRLATARSARGLTQGELAMASGMKQPDISKMERGQIVQTTGMARIAAALRVPASWLELGAGPQPDWVTASDAGAADTRPAPWPLRRWTPDQWSAIDPLDRAVMEDAAMSKWRELQSERTARPFAAPEKPQARAA